MPFIDEAAFRNWCHQNGYDEQTIALIERIRSSPPSRNVTGGRGNVRARIPSHKMGVTIQSETRTAEKPGIRVFYEYDHLLERQTETEVIEYYDQPDKIPMKYLSSASRSLTVWHTPDFFVIREDGAGWEEWKTASELEGLCSVSEFLREATGAEGPILRVLAPVVAHFLREGCASRIVFAPKEQP